MQAIKAFKKFEIPITHVQASRISRVHIGLVQLSTDHSLEMDWAKLLGTQAGVFSSRVYYSSEMTAEALDKISTGISEASDLIATGLAMDVMAFGCTSASIIIGEEKVSKLLTKNRGDIPSTNPWTAAQAAFKYLNAKKIALFSPYPTEVNFHLYQQLTNAGFEVAVLGSLGIKKTLILPRFQKNQCFKGLIKYYLNQMLIWCLCPALIYVYLIIFKRLKRSSICLLFVVIQPCSGMPCISVEKFPNALVTDGY
jgi:maleate isomerase